MTAQPCGCGHDRGWHWNGRGCAGGGGVTCTCRQFNQQQTGDTHMTAHGEFPQGYGIRVGDNVHYMGPTGEEGRVTRVDYSAHLAYVEFTNSSGWEQFRHLWAQAVLDSEPNHVPVTA